MGVPTSEVGNTPAMLRREDHEVHKGNVVALGEKKKKKNRVQMQWSIIPLSQHAVLKVSMSYDGSLLIFSVSQAKWKILDRVLAHRIQKMYSIKWDT